MQRSMDSTAPTLVYLDDMLILKEVTIEIDTEIDSKCIGVLFEIGDVCHTSPD